MNRSFKIILSVIFVLAVSFWVARGCIPKKPISFPKSVQKMWQPAKKKALSPKPSKKSVRERREPAPAKRSGSKMAIILDDWGLNASLTREAIALKRPLTLAILPHLSHSRDIAESAHAHGLGVMLHMPMEPKNLRQPKEPYVIRTTSSDEEIRALLDSALESVPYVEGVNNHQGSAATSDVRVMKSVLTHLKRKGLFFVDSRVVASSVGWKLARDLGLPYTSRDVFIDNESVVDAVKAQLVEAEEKAIANGSVVVIGHDKKVTLEAIRQMIPEIESKGIKLVLVKELLQ